MQFLKFLYLWFAVLVFLEWYGRRFPWPPASEAATGPGAGQAGKAAARPAEDFRGPAGRRLGYF